MAGVKDFTELIFWQRARQSSKRIFFFTKRSPFASDKRLVSQLNDSSESVIANIAEGFGRGTQGEFIQFLGYALGSLNETQGHLALRLIASISRARNSRPSIRKRLRFERWPLVSFAR